ncbi:MAG: bifunctional alpha,alpha-trehalose-phosphate synthase (UDP-forming)/trehalose-phosphatase [Thermodesulfobacteriota bacterium]
MKKLIIVSNRLPITVKEENNKLSFEPSMGGLATGLSSLESEYEKHWIGWPGIDHEKRSENEIAEIERQLAKDRFYPVYLNSKEIESYYQGFCNEIIWPLFHYFVQYGIYNKEFWESYVEVNEKFCEAVLKVAKKGDYIWIHDYHLMLLPKLIRANLEDSNIGFFLHIPFPSSEIFRLIPWCRDIINGLLGSDLIGFHTFDYVRHFAESARRILGHEHSLGQLFVEKRAVKMDTFPMGIDYEKFSTAHKKVAVKKNINEIKRSLNGNYKIILSIDRLDYSKGIPERLKAYDLFLEKNPEIKEKVLLILVAVPSRTEVVHYKMLKAEVDTLVGNINGKYGTISWNPIHYMYRSFDFENLIALYLIADVLFITPLRDGMNLIAKEYVASRNDKTGVLILGEMAGTAKELSEALIINPNDLEATSDALKIALQMKKTEQNKRMTGMQKRLKRYDLKVWTEDFMERLNHIKEIQDKMLSKKLNSQIIDELFERYKKSRKCLFLLDYDGSMVPFTNNPQDAKPDKELYKVLKILSGNPKNEVVVISGRDKESLGKWLGAVTNGLSAEHGLWIMDDGWKIIDTLSDKWKKEVKPILEIFVDRTPGSLIEEKSYSLAWHYRNVDPALSNVRVGELKDTLSHITTNLGVGVLEGNKVIEIKHTSINKGKAALRWIESDKWDTIISIGDDWTDEYVFDVLPKDAYSIKVGFGPSKAKYRLPSVKEVRNLLYYLADSD